MKKPRISIIGLGRVGSALLKDLNRHGFQVLSVFNRSEISSEIRSSYPETKFRKSNPKTKHEFGELIFITTPDSVIPEIAASIAYQRDTLVGKFFVHCSGTLLSEVLQPVKEKGAEVASFHPMKSITPKTENLSDTWFDLEGDEAAVSMLENIADALGSHTFRVEPEAKPFLHASAVMASNYLVVLADLASKISEMGNVPKNTAVKALSSLMEHTLKNVSDLGTEEALTGPIIRGDLETVQDHVNMLRENPEILKAYKMLGLRSLDIVERNQEPTQAHLKIKKLLS